MNVDVIINDIKKIEIDRLKDFHSSNPEMFILVDISLIVDDMKKCEDDELTRMYDLIRETCPDIICFFRN
jgi:hypothetical protein